MQKDRVIIVHLRRPKSKADDPEEKRSDPFWEFGSFGITTCHGWNLMHPRNAESLNGARLAFAQGGKRGTRLVHLTPPVKVRKHCDRIEAVWSPPEMPFRYSNALILVSNTAKSHFPELESTMKAGGSPTLEGQFGCNFRGRATCIADLLANELVSIYTKKRKEAQDSEIACFYEEALPWPPPLVDRNRERTYTQFLSEARGSKPRHGCGSRKRPRPCSPTRRRDRPC